jgi:NAD(P)-dependent dehydrogenase (short-subunit alcohol dehydrogenase family)/acyl carrier protein
VEQPQRWGGLIDLDPARVLAEQLDALLLTLTTASREDQFALRGGATLTARLFPTPARRDLALPAFTPRTDGLYLITGGLGGLGFLVARWLAARGARHLLLLGRGVPDAARAEEIAALERKGVTVTVRSVDLGDAAALALALKAPVGAPALRGVFHAAGAWEDCTLAELTPEALAATWRAKAAGASHLEAALGETPLDAFVLFSAFSSLLPAPRQGNYAAANAFLDALAWRRRARGRAALSVSWGPWSEIGFAATDYGRRAHSRLDSIGITRFSPDTGIAVLERALADGRTHLGAMVVDWSRLFTADPAAALSPLLGELFAAHTPVVEPAADPGRIARTLVGLTPAAQRARLAVELGAVIAGVLRMKPADLSAAAPLPELGVDSLVAIEIKNRIQRDAGVDVPLTRLLAGPTIAILADELLPQVKLAAMATTAAQNNGVGEEIEI